MRNQTISPSRQRHHVPRGCYMRNWSFDDPDERKKHRLIRHAYDTRTETLRKMARFAEPWLLFAALYVLLSCSK